jgi:hypothetical protein
MRGKGGGPKSADGKAKVGRNAVKHGLRMVGPIVRGMEDEADWKRHLDGIVDSLQPDGYHEHVLAERIALLLWRTRRIAFYELARNTIRRLAMLTPRASSPRALKPASCRK